MAKRVLGGHDVWETSVKLPSGWPKTGGDPVLLEPEFVEPAFVQKVRYVETECQQRTEHGGDLSVDPQDHRRGSR